MKYSIINRGFTFIETVIFIALFSVIIIAIVSSIRFVYKGERYNFESASAIRSARVGVENMVRDIRESAYSDIGDYPVINMSTSSLMFFSDIDRDAKIEQVRYFIESGTLKKGVLESSGDPPEYLLSNESISNVSENVRNEELEIPLFTYYDKSGVEMNDLSQITDMAFVLVRLIINLEPDRAPNDFELRSSAALRNVNSVK